MQSRLRNLIMLTAVLFQMKNLVVQSQKMMKLLLMRNNTIMEVIMVRAIDTDLHEPIIEGHPEGLRDLQLLRLIDRLHRSREGIH